MPSRPRRAPPPKVTGIAGNHSISRFTHSKIASTSRRLKASITRLAISTFACDIAYPSKPHGFEGLLVAEVVHRVDDLPVTSRYDVANGRLDFDPARSAAK